MNPTLSATLGDCASRTYTLPAGSAAIGAGDPLYDADIGADFELNGDPDSDGDGSPDSEDCAPADASIFPGAVEVVGDGIDQDCDGSDLVACFEDMDNDGFGSATRIYGPDDDCAGAGMAYITGGLRRRRRLHLPRGRRGHR